MVSQAGNDAAPPASGQTNGFMSGGMNGGLSDQPRGPGAERGQGSDAHLGQQLLDFWTNICVCHSLISEAHPVTSEPIFQVSPLWQMVVHSPMPNAAADELCWPLPHQRPPDS